MMRTVPKMGTGVGEARGAVPKTGTGVGEARGTVPKTGTGVGEARGAVPRPGTRAGEAPGFTYKPEVGVGNSPAEVPASGTLLDETQENDDEPRIPSARRAETPESPEGSPSQLGRFPSASSIPR